MKGSTVQFATHFKPVLESHGLTAAAFAKRFGVPFARLVATVAPYAETLRYVHQDMMSYGPCAFDVWKLLRTSKSWKRRTDLVGFAQAALDYTAFAEVFKPNSKAMTRPSTAMIKHCHEVREEVRAELKRDLEALATVKVRKCR